MINIINAVCIYVDYNEIPEYHGNICKTQLNTNSFNYSRCNRVVSTELKTINVRYEQNNIKRVRVDKNRKRFLDFERCDVSHYLWTVKFSIRKEQCIKIIHRVYEIMTTERKLNNYKF